MALYLSAEQKNLKSLFSNDDRYIIPSYQRHYSWTMEECKQLYDDVLEAFESNTDSYFLGNIVLAEGEKDDRPEVVDGQQRLITLWLYLKSLCILQPNNNRLKRMIQVESYEEESTSDYLSKISSDVFEVKDQMQIDEVLRKSVNDYEAVYDQYSDKNENLNYKSCTKQVVCNGYAIYALLKDYLMKISIDKQKSFVDYFISKVYVLPIVLKDDDLDVARSNALMVFETINNRGMDLQDADIFKAKLYQMSLTIGKGDEFIRKWKEINSRCEDLNIKIDDLFRYYYHIIRGREGIIVAEKRLREFFQKDNKSPFKKGDYGYVLSSLLDTLDAIEYYRNKLNEPSRLAAWIQILDAYTNQNPVYAFVVYIYYHKTASDEELISFLKKILRYCYYRGSTMSVKFEIYNIIYKVASGQDIDNYLVKNVDEWMWNNPGRLRKGLTLLAFYLSSSKQTAIDNYRVDKIIKTVDLKSLSNDWNHQDLEDEVNSLGNSIVLDMPQRSTPILQRYKSYSNSKIEEVRNLTSDNSGFTHKKFLDRITHISSVLEDFFVNGKG